MWYQVEFCNELCCICIDPGFCCTWNDGNQRSPRFADLKLKSFFIFGEALVVIQNRGISNENTISFYVLFTFFTHTNPLHCVRRVAQRLVGNLQEWKGWTALLLPPAVQVRCGKWVCARGALHREWTRLHSSRVEAVLSGVGRWRPDYQLNFAPTTCCFPYTMFFPHNGRFEQNFSNFLPLLPFPSPIKEYIGFVLSLSLLRKHFM